jgi:ribosomal protein L20
VALIKLGMVKDKTITNYKRQVCTMRNSMVSGDNLLNSDMVSDFNKAKIKLQINGKNLSQLKINQEIQFQEIDKISKRFT